MDRYVKGALETLRQMKGGDYVMIELLSSVEPKRPEIIRCKNCRHDNNCEIQYAAQAGSKFFCGAAERQEGMPPITPTERIGECGYCPTKRDGIITIVSKDGDTK